jgi:hypothetical protein
VPEPAEEFRKRAADCFRWAQSASAERARAAWLGMAQFWLQLAQSEERDDSQADGSPAAPPDPR